VATGSHYRGSVVSHTRTINLLISAVQ
jgi:hypothetical protein